MKRDIDSSLILIFSANVRLIREKKGISQEKLAELANLHRTYIGSVERGERKVSLINVEKLAHALNTTPVGLLTSIVEE